MKKRLLAMLLVAAMAVSIVACGAEKEEAPAEDAVVEEDAAAEEETPAEDSEAGYATAEEWIDAVVSGSLDLEECTLTFLHNGTAASEAQMWDDFVAGFMEVYPQVTVEVQNGGTDAKSVLATKINADEVPDIYFTGGASDCDYYYDYLYDFRDDAELMLIFDTILHEDYKKICYASDGKIVGVPNQVTAYGMIYNKDLFEQAGITELPVTIEDWKVACEKLTDAGITPFCNGYKDWWVVRHNINSYFGAGFDDFATEMYPALTTGGMKIADLPHIQEMFDFLDLIMEYSVPNTMELDAAAATAVLANGEAAVQNNGTWNTGSYVDINPDIRLGFIPEAYDNPEDVKLISYVTGTISISDEPENFEATKALFTYFIHKLATTEAGVNQKCLMSTLTDMSLNTNELMIEAFNMENTRDCPAVYWSMAFDTEVGYIVQEYLIGNYDRDQCIEAIQTAWDDLCPPVEE